MTLATAAPPARPRPLSSAELDAFGRELDGLRDRIVADLGARDVAHIRNVIRASRYGEVAGRVLLHFGIDPLSFVLGVAALGTAKILENMEIGHNVMHGQYDWTKDPELDSRTYEWDTTCTGDDWRHSHNYEHHTYTNVLGKDRDVGYGVLRMAPEQEWRLAHLGQPLYALLLALAFEWGVGAHDLRVEEYADGRRPAAELPERARPFLRKAGWQVLKDYGLFPLLALANAPRVLVGNLLANGMRNVWAFAVIFCGHFPEGVHVFREDETRNESRGAWYRRQMLGSANIEGGRLFHLLTGHLSHQIEHHLYPDLPAARYPEMAETVREIAERYGQTYATGGFAKQLASVAKRIVALSLPDRGASPAATLAAAA